MAERPSTKSTQRWVEYHGCSQTCRPRYMFLHTRRGVYQDIRHNSINAAMSPLATKESRHIGRKKKTGFTQKSSGVGIL
ncbi:hypothetical protein I7I48_03048 [Histoplasma ohiense]|nr:hypothetical protein I7I48_03048 [Histoplasma ohiense (nom. inval.)]